MAWPDDPLPDPSTWMAGFVGAPAFKINLIDQLNSLVARLSDSGWVLTGALGLNAAGSSTGSARSTIVQMAMRKVGPACWVFFKYNLGATISIPDSGDVGNKPIIQLPAMFTPSSLPSAIGSQSLPSAGDGAVVIHVVNSAGVISIASATANANLTAGSLHSFSGSFAL